MNTEDTLQVINTDKKRYVLTSFGVGLLLSEAQRKLVEDADFLIVRQEDISQGVESLFSQIDSFGGEEPPVPPIMRQSRQSIPFWANDWRKKHKR